MDLLRPSVLKELCARVGIRPDRKAGQNFLINRATLNRIVDAVDPQPGDTILEVGAGFGVLTLALAERLKDPEGVRWPSDQNRVGSERKNGAHGGGRIIAIERDRDIAAVLRDIVRGGEIPRHDSRVGARNDEEGSEFVESHENVEVVEGDVLRLLKFILSPGAGSGRRISPTHDVRTSSTATRMGEMFRRSAPQHKLKVAANLPYSITSDFLRLLYDAVGTGAMAPPERAVLLLQREVVDRLCADPRRPGDRKNVGILTMVTALHCTPRRICRVPAAHFWPAPKVESAVVALEAWRAPSEIEELFDDAPPPLAPPPRGKGRNLRESFLHIVRVAFTHRRKQMGSMLGRDPSLALRMTRSGIDPTARPETLTLEQWIALAQAAAEQ